MSEKKFMVLVLEYDLKQERIAEKALDELRAKKAVKVSCHYQGSDERVVDAVKKNLANAE